MKIGMKEAYIDAHGTLVSNPTTTWNAALQIITDAIASGWTVYLSSSDVNCPRTPWGQTLAGLGVQFCDKGTALAGARRGATVIDDEEHILRCVARAGGRAIHARDLAGGWWK